MRKNNTNILLYKDTDHSIFIFDICNLWYQKVKYANTEIKNEFEPEFGLERKLSL